MHEGVFRFVFIKCQEENWHGQSAVRNDYGFVPVWISCTDFKRKKDSVKSKNMEFVMYVFKKHVQKNVFDTMIRFQVWNKIFRTYHVVCLKHLNVFYLLEIRN